MEDILKLLDVKGEMKKKEIYRLLKTNSKKINSEISKKIKSFKKIDDFLIYYSNKSSLLDLLNKIESNSFKNFDEIFSSFDPNIELYISCFTQIIISVKLILKTQEILNNILSSSKQYLSKLKMEQKIENISQKNLFFFIENLINISGTKTSRSFSGDFTMFRSKSCNSFLDNLLHYQNFNNNQCLKTFSNIDIGKNLKNLYEEPCTPTFGGSKSDKKFVEEKEYCQNIHIKKNSSFSLCDEIISFRDEKVVEQDKSNNSIKKNVSTNEKKYENLLEMINNIYRKGIINSEEKIKLKQLVIAKSKKLENLYNTCTNKLIDQNDLRLKITKLLN